MQDTAEIRAAAPVNECAAEVITLIMELSGGPGSAPPLAFRPAAAAACREAEHTGKPILQAALERKTETPMKSNPKPKTDLIKLKAQSQEALRLLRMTQYRAAIRQVSEEVWNWARPKI
jgi:hypothetical protein